MKIIFDDKSYIECKKSDNGGILIIISAKDNENKLKRISNAVELTIEEFTRLISEV
jgi:hypothetical protein